MTIQIRRRDVYTPKMSIVYVDNRQRCHSGVILKVYNQTCEVKEFSDIMRIDLRQIVSIIDDTESKSRRL